MHSYLGLENLLFTIKWDFREYWNQSISSILFILLLIGLSYYVNIQWQKYKSQAGLPWKIGLVLFVIFATIYNFYSDFISIIRIFLLFHESYICMLYNLYIVRFCAIRVCSIIISRQGL